MDVHASKLFCDRETKPKQPQTYAKRRDTLCKTGVVLLTSNPPEEHYDFERWHIAQRDVTCGDCQNKVRKGWPYQTFHCGHEDGESVMLFCVPCAIAFYDGQEQLRGEPT